MCLAVPGEIVSLEAPDGDPQISALYRTGKVRFGGILRQVNLAYVPEAGVGDYVIVHAGFALSLLDQAEAQRTLQQLSQLSLEPGGASAAPSSRRDQTRINFNPGENSHHDIHEKSGCNH